MIPTKIAEFVSTHDPTIKNMYKFLGLIEECYYKYKSNDLTITPIIFDKHSVCEYISPVVKKFGPHTFKKKLFVKHFTYFKSLKACDLKYYASNAKCSTGFHKKVIINTLRQNPIVMAVFLTFFKKIPANALIEEVKTNIKIYCAKKSSYDKFTNPTAFRPISALPVFGIILEKLFIEQFDVNKLSSSQFRHKSIDDARMQVHMAKNRTFLDVKNAFPNVSIDKLINLMREYSVNPEFIYYVNEFYHNLFVEYNSDYYNWNFGLLQGSPTSALLFCIYIDPYLRDLQKVFGKDNVICYMDDIAIINTDQENVRETAIGIAEQHNLAINKKGEIIDENFCYLGDTLFNYRGAFLQKFRKKMDELESLDLSSTAKRLIYEKFFKNKIERHKKTYRICGDRNIALAIDFRVKEFMNNIRNIIVPIDDVIEEITKYRAEMIKTLETDITY